MTPSDSKKLEEIKEAWAIKYDFTMQNWPGKPIRDDLQDMDWLLSKVTERDQEIERLREEKRYINGLLEIEQGTVQEQLTRAEKAEAELAQLQKYNEVLKSQRADVYDGGVEDGKREAEAE
ncbi:unnamed protein product, partial [marine sediment metagenome]